MKVDGTTVPNNSEKKQQKMWIIIFSIFAVMIVGLVIAIVVVIVNRGGGDDEIGIEIVEYDERGEEYYKKMTKYVEYIDEINNKIFEYELEDSGTAIAELYKAYADKAEDIEVKNMLLKDYYFEIMSYDFNKSRQEEVINGLKAVDEALQTFESALSVADAALYYDRKDIVSQYNEIARGRGYTEEMGKLIGEDEIGEGDV